MSEELRNLIVETQDAFRADPAEAQATFESVSSLGEGFRSEVALRDHRLVVDEPESLGGTDTGPNPVELILAALGTCQEITYRAYAAALGIPLEHVAVTLEGDIDLRGFFAVDESVRPGYQKLRGTVRVVSSADEETLANAPAGGQRTLPGARHRLQSGAGGAHAGEDARAQAPRPPNRARETDIPQCPG